MESIRSNICSAINRIKESLCNNGNVVKKTNNATEIGRLRSLKQCVSKALCFDGKHVPHALTKLRKLNVKEALSNFRTNTSKRLAKSEEKIENRVGYNRKMTDSNVQIRNASVHYGDTPTEYENYNTTTEYSKLRKSAFTERMQQEISIQKTPEIVTSQRQNPAENKDQELKNYFNKHGGDMFSLVYGDRIEETMENPLFTLDEKIELLIAYKRTHRDEKFRTTFEKAFEAFNEPRVVMAKQDFNRGILEVVTSSEFSLDEKTALFNKYRKVYPNDPSLPEAEKKLFASFSEDYTTYLKEHSIEETVGAYGINIQEMLGDSRVSDECKQQIQKLINEKSVATRSKPTEQDNSKQQLGLYRQNFLKQQAIAKDFRFYNEYSTNPLYDFFVKYDIEAVMADIEGNKCFTDTEKDQIRTYYAMLYPKNTSSSTDPIQVESETILENQGGKLKQAVNGNDISVSAGPVQPVPQQPSVIPQADTKLQSEKPEQPGETFTKTANGPIEQQTKLTEREIAERQKILDIVKSPKKNILEKKEAIEAYEKTHGKSKFVDQLWQKFDDQIDQENAKVLRQHIKDDSIGEFLADLEDGDVIKATANKYLKIDEKKKLLDTYTRLHIFTDDNALYVIQAIEEQIRAEQEAEVNEVSVKNIPTRNVTKPKLNNPIKREDIESFKTDFHAHGIKSALKQSKADILDLIKSPDLSLLEKQRVLNEYKKIDSKRNFTSLEQELIVQINNNEKISPSFSIELLKLSDQNPEEWAQQMIEAFNRNDPATFHKEIVSCFGSDGIFPLKDLSEKQRKNLLNTISKKNLCPHPANPKNNPEFPLLALKYALEKISGKDVDGEDGEITQFKKYFNKETYFPLTSSTQLQQFAIMQRNEFPNPFFEVFETFDKLTKQ